VNST
jgi:hypothetical protein